MSFNVSSTHSFKFYAYRHRVRRNNCFGAQAFNKRTLDALKFDQGKNQTKKTAQQMAISITADSLEDKLILSVVLYLSVESAINPVVLLASCAT